MRFRASRAPVLSSIRNSRLDCGGDGHLRVIAGGIKLRDCAQQRGMKLVGALDGRAQHRRAHAVNARPPASRISSPCAAKTFEIEIGEGLGKGAARLPGIRQRVHRVG